MTNFLIFILNLLFFLKKALEFILAGVIFRFTRAILRFFFYKVVVKIYQAYFSIIKRLGWAGFRNSPVLFLIRQKLVHISVLTITVLIVFSNVAAKAKVEDSTRQASKTILAGLVENEFYSLDQEPPVEDYLDAEPAGLPLPGQYIDNEPAIKTEPILNTKSDNPVETAAETGLAMTEDGTAIVKQDIVETAKTKRPRADIVYYTVAVGDVLGRIADKFDLNVSTILWENNLTAYSIIRPGDTLTILPMDGVTYKIAKGDTLEKIASKYGLTKDSITEANQAVLASGLPVGKTILLPGGRKTAAPRVVVASKPASSGLQVLKNLLTPQAPSAAPATGNKLNWPTVGYRITQYYSWRHQAIDIANKVGTPIYAADDGVIEIAGWGTGYGNTILIDHGGGMKTRYGHLSQFYVKKGDEVVKGEAIGAMGSTGWSTGPHLHFEIIIGKVKYNPLNYLAR